MVVTLSKPGNKDSLSKRGLSVKQGERNLCSYFNPLWQAHTRSAHLPNFYFALQHEHSLLGSYFQPVGGRAGVSRTRSCCWLPDALHIWLIVGNILTHLTIYIPVFNGWALIIARCVMPLIAWCVHFFRLVGVLIWPDAYFANLWHNFMPPLKLAGVLMWKGAYFAYLFEHHWNIFYAIACSLCPYFKWSARVTRIFSNQMLHWRPAYHYHNVHNYARGGFK